MMTADGVVSSPCGKIFLMRIRVSLCAATALAVALVAGCGGSSGSHANTSTTSATKATVAQIDKNWIAFFNPSTPTSNTVSLLQNGSKFASAINAQAKSPFAKESSVTVSSTKLTSPTTATVTFTLKIAGQPVPGLKNATGTAIKTGNTWQVADSTFCKLLKLQGPAPAACPKG